MENVDVDVLCMPDSQQLKAPQQMDEDEDSIDRETSVNLFNLESVVGQVFQHRKKKMEGEFDGDDADDEEDSNPLAVLDETELDEEIEVSSEDMADWLRKLHIRTQHLVGKVTVNGMSRLAATNHVATALTRFKGRVRLDCSDKRVTSADENSNGLDTDEAQSTPETPTTPPTEISKGVNENPTKGTAVRSKRISKQSSKTEPKTQRRHRETSNITSGTNKATSISETSSRINKTPKPHPSASLPAKTDVDIGSARKTSNKVSKPAVKSVRSGIKSKVIH